MCSSYTKKSALIFGVAAAFSCLHIGTTVGASSRSFAEIEAERAAKALERANTEATDAKSDLKTANDELVTAVAEVASKTTELSTATTDAQAAKSSLVDAKADAMEAAREVVRAEYAVSRAEKAVKEADASVQAVESGDDATLKAAAKKRKAEADERKTEAEAAKKAADDRKTKADKAVTDAEKTKSEKDKAFEKAVEAKAKADSALMVKRRAVNSATITKLAKEAYVKIAKKRINPRYIPIAPPAEIADTNHLGTEDCAEHKNNLKEMCGSPRGLLICGQMCADFLLENGSKKPKNFMKFDQDADLSAGGPNCKLDNTKSFPYRRDLGKHEFCELFAEGKAVNTWNRSPDAPKTCKELRDSPVMADKMALYHCWVECGICGGLRGEP